MEPEVNDYWQQIIHLFNPSVSNGGISEVLISEVRSHGGDDGVKRFMRLIAIWCRRGYLPHDARLAAEWRYALYGTETKSSITGGACGDGKGGTSVTSASEPPSLQEACGVASEPTTAISGVPTSATVRRKCGAAVLSTSKGSPTQPTMRAPRVAPVPDIASRTDFPPLGK